MTIGRDNGNMNEENEEKQVLVFPFKKPKGNKIKREDIQAKHSEGSLGNQTSFSCCPWAAPHNTANNLSISVNVFGFYGCQAPP